MLIISFSLDSVIEELGTFRGLILPYSFIFLIFWCKIGREIKPFWTKAIHDHKSSIAEDLKESYNRWGRIVTIVKAQERTNFTRGIDEQKKIGKPVNTLGE
jgi:hypothetical protein